MIGCVTGRIKTSRFETNTPEIWAGQQSFVNFGFQQDIVTKGKMRVERTAADQLVRREQASFQLDCIEDADRSAAAILLCIGGQASAAGLDISPGER